MAHSEDIFTAGPAGLELTVQRFRRYQSAEETETVTCSKVRCGGVIEAQVDGGHIDLRCGECGFSRPMTVIWEALMRTFLAALDNENEGVVV